MIRWTIYYNFYISYDIYEIKLILEVGIIALLFLKTGITTLLTYDSFSTSLFDVGDSLRGFLILGILILDSWDISGIFYLSFFRLLFADLYTVLAVCLTNHILFPILIRIEQSNQLKYLNQL